MKNRRSIQLLVILLVGLLMPSYYKVKYLILEVITWSDIFNWLLLLEIGFGLMLGTVVVFGHDWVAQALRKQGSTSSFLQRFIVQYGLSTCYSVGAAIGFSYFFWHVIVPMEITGEFLFDYGVLGLLLPILLNGISESFYFYGKWEKESYEKTLLEKENIKAKYEVLQNQLSPHFLFNCFNTLAVLIDESRATAVKFLHQLSKVYRYVLEMKDQELVSLYDEMQSMEAYVELMKHRYGDSFKVLLPEESQLANQRLVPLTLQILLENALKHNEFSDQQPLEVQVAIERDKLSVINPLRSNGNQSGTGIGLNNLRSRYQAVLGSSLEITAQNEAFRVDIPLISDK
ncbi:MAG: histidine kinase [Cytophagales bacterium]|nr:histidine kinase [Cytophagales bacterium]